MTLTVDARVRVGAFTLHTALTAEPDELVAVVGPNGAGKTTLVRMLAGLQPADEGTVVLDGRTLDDGGTAWIPPPRRNVGYISQRDHLFPSMSVLDNVAFGLRHRGFGRAAARAEAARWLDVVGLADVAGRRPRELSGGQAKRVALARALAVRPSLLLLDEPFAGLDASTRLQVRRELRTYLASHRCARILVTHEPVDALSLADRIVVLEDGRVVQTALPDEISLHPRSRYVADLVGINLLHGTVHAGRIHTDRGLRIVAADPPADGSLVALTLHPRAIALHLRRPEGSPRNVWPMTVQDVDREGDRVRVRLSGPGELTAEVTSAGASALGIRPGLDVFASVKGSEVQVLPE